MDNALPATANTDLIHVLWISSNASHTILQRQLCDTAGLRVLDVETPAEAFGHLSCTAFDVILLGVPFEGWRTEQLMEEIFRRSPGTPLLIHDLQGSVPDAVRLTKLGAFQYLTGPVDAERLLSQIESASKLRPSISLMRLADNAQQGPWRGMVIGESAAMRRVADLARIVAARRSTVLITGETGTGKEVIARAIHMASNRAAERLVCVNCAALPENLIEAELFGHVRGAFTGASGNRVGRFEQANRGTIFLDEISEMPLEVQSKLLRVLQEREFERLGSSEPVKVDVRVIAASNVDLQEAVREGKFRADLFYRLNVVPVRLPALRERMSDIPALVQHFVEKICRFEGIPSRIVLPETLSRLAEYHWPGNVRELEHAVERAITLSEDRTTLYPSDFDLPSTNAAETSSALPFITIPEQGLDLADTISRVERAIVQQALFKTGGNKSRAADLLRMKRSTFQARIDNPNGLTTAGPKEAFVA
jgi:DNA-binding NtrC family response regulator